jgi:hypothetical protein
VADTIPPVLIELQLETAKIAAQMQQLTGDFAKFGQTVEKQGGFLDKFKATASGVFAGNLMVTGLNAIKGAITGAIQDAQEYEVLLSKTAAVIESTGNVAGISVASLKAHASALEEISAVDENMILNGENVIATFTNIRNAAGEGNDIFNQTTAAALDLSVALGQDMQSSAIQLGKALNDPIKGVSALQRVGVTFDAQQKESIKTMVESGNVMGAQKIILAEMNKEFGGAAAAAGDTFAGAVSRAKDKVQDFARDLITNLQPILLNIGKTIGDLYNKFLAPLFSWLGKNKEAIAAMVAVIITAIAAIKLYNAALVVGKGIMAAYKVAQVLMTGGQLASIASTNGLAASMLKLNATMAANPIGLIVAGIALLVAGFVVAWNHSETFRKVVIKGLQIVLNGVGYLVGGFAKLIGLFAKIPGMGWAKGIADGAAKAADKIRETSDGLDKLAKTKISIPGFGGGKDDTGKEGGANAPGGGKTAEQIKAEKAAAKQRVKDIAAANKDVKEIYSKMNDAIDDGNKKMSDALTKRAKAVVEAKKKYAELEVKITEKKNEELAKNEQEWTKAYAKAREEASKRNAEIESDYAKKKAAIEKDYTEKKADLNAAAQDKINDATAKAAEKQASIVQKSIDRLTNAFASATATSVGQIFKDGFRTADSMIEQLKSKLSAAKELQANAGALAAAGYSQVFIEEVVKQGPELGNEMAKALLSASSDTQKELQSLYGEVNTISDSGLNDLATTMNAGGKLATQELINEFNEVPKQLAGFIEETNKDLKNSLTKANSDYLEKLAEAATTRDEALAESKARLNEALKEADTALADANAATMKEFNDAIKENAANLAETLANIQQDYEDAIAQIAENTKEKLAELQKDLLAAADALKKLGEAKAAANAIANVPVFEYAPIIPSAPGFIGSTAPGSVVTDSQNQAKYATYFNTTVTGVNMTDPAAAAKAVDNAVRFGSTQGLSPSQIGMMKGIE